MGWRGEKWDVKFICVLCTIYTAACGQLEEQSPVANWNYYTAMAKCHFTLANPVSTTTAVVPSITAWKNLLVLPPPPVDV
jgi:hypothetical protein